LPFATAIIPFLIDGPAAVISVTLRITSGADGRGVYVLANGSAFGVDTPPGPVADVESFDVTGVGAWLVFAGAHAVAATIAAANSI
jgi:hypothetical protein